MESLPETVVFLPETADGKQDVGKAAVSSMPGAFGKGTTRHMFEWIKAKGYEGEEPFQKYHARKANGETLADMCPPNNRELLLHHAEEDPISEFVIRNFESGDQQDFVPLADIEARWCCQQMPGRKPGAPRLVEYLHQHDFESARFCRKRNDGKQSKGILGIRLLPE